MFVWSYSLLLLCYIILHRFCWNFVKVYVRLASALNVKFSFLITQYVKNKVYRSQAYVYVTLDDLFILFRSFGWLDSKDI